MLWVLKKFVPMRRFFWVLTTKVLTSTNRDILEVRAVYSSLSSPLKIRRKKISKQQNIHSTTDSVWGLHYKLNEWIYYTTRTSWQLQLCNALQLTGQIRLVGACLDQSYLKKKRICNVIVQVPILQPLVQRLFIYFQKRIIPNKCYGGLLTHKLLNLIVNFVGFFGMNL